MNLLGEVSAQLFDHFIFPAEMYDSYRESLPKSDYVSAFRVSHSGRVVARSHHVFNLHFLKATIFPVVM